MIRVEVKFTNKDGVEETAWGRLLLWKVVFSEDRDYSWVDSYIVLDDGRIVTTESTNEDYTPLTYKYVEQTRTNLIEHEDIELGFNKIIE